MIEIGKINTLTILRVTTVGLYLGDEDKNDVLLPNSFIKDNYKVGDKLDVFIYNDSEDRIIATTKTPYAKINEFAYGLVE
jgi:predicted RNA-binding protein (virulence factor B family)